MTDHRGPEDPESPEGAGRILVLTETGATRRAPLPERLNQLTHAVIGAAIEVHRVLGPGLLESVYEKALAIELGDRELRFVRQPIVPLFYKGQPIGEGRLDFLIENELVVELKAIEAILGLHEAQVISYLKTTGFPLALLINFNVPILRDGIRRIVRA